MTKPTFIQSSLLCSTSFSLIKQFQKQLLPMLFLSSLLFLCFLFISLYKKLKRDITAYPLSAVEHSLSLTLDKTSQIRNTHKLFVEILNSNPQKWAPLISSFPSSLPVEDIEDDRISDRSELDKDGNLIGEEERVKKKKKRARKKKQNSQAEESEGQLPILQEKIGLDSLYPFTSSSSVTQRKIKQQYDQLVKSHDSNALILAQVSQFANCLTEARNDLQHKSEIIQRKFTITKALLFKADRSSFDRISQQIYKLQEERKRLEEDAVVYNRLQEQLKLSPAYKKMLEIDARAELEAGSGQPPDTNYTESEFPDISFEEFLAQEKKDSFWQKNGKLRSYTN